MYTKEAVQKYSRGESTILDCKISMIDVVVGPETVSISGLELPMSSGRDYRLTCSSSGSVPPARLSWWRGDRRIRQYNHKVSLTATSGNKEAV